jgi:MoxR-like ATPase
MNNPSESSPNLAALERQVGEFNQRFTVLESEVSRVIVGQREIIRRTLSTIFAGGHVLLEGVPGLGKTLLVKSIARAFGLNFKRIQFTPDLMPSDVTGTQVLTEDDSGKRRFVFKPGPVFGNIILADEINRATPKTQAALLEAMEERQITVLDQTHQLPKPFFVLATQNPVELEGTYPLPEAQLDRFMVKLLVTPPTRDELKEVLNRTTGNTVPAAATVFPAEEMLATFDMMRHLVREVILSGQMQEVIVRLLAALTPGTDFTTEMVKKYVRFGAGPRGAQAIVLSAKVHALRNNRVHVSYDDIRSVLNDCLRHRLILNFEADADGVSTDTIIDQVRNAK